MLSSFSGWHLAALLGVVVLVAAIVVGVVFIVRAAGGRTGD